MVSPDSSTEGSGSGSSIDEKEKRFYTRPSRQPPSSTPSQSESQSASSEEILTLPQKKNPTRTPTIPSKPSSSKRPRNEEEETANKKTKKQKATKEEPKKTNEDKRKGKKPDPQPSPQKSTAKKPVTWNPKEEIDFLKALVAYCQDGKSFPKNSLTPVYDYVRSLNMLDHDYSNSQLGEKFRRLRVKFFTMRDKVKGGGFSFKNAHDEVLYKMSKKIWGKEEDEEDSEEEESEKSEEQQEVGNGIKEERVVKEEEEVEDKKAVKEEESKSTGEDVEMTQKKTDEIEEDGEENGVEMTQEEHKQNLVFPGLRKHVAVKEAVPSKHAVSNGTISNRVEDNKGGKLIDQLRKENSVIMDEMKVQLITEIKEFRSDILKTVREVLHSSVNGKTSNSIGFSSEEAVKNNYSARELPALDAYEAKLLEQKWKRQHLVELEACSGHLALLQEECQKRTENLHSLVDEESY